MNLSGKSFHVEETVCAKTLTQVCDGVFEDSEMGVAGIEEGRRTADDRWMATKLHSF